MAEERLHLEHERVLEKTVQLGEAIMAYRELGMNPLSSSVASLEEMHSNFTARLGRMLGSLDGKNPNLLENIETINETAAEIAQNLRELDVDIASAMGSEE